MAEPLPGRPAPQSVSSKALPVEAAREFLGGLKRPCRLLVAYSGGGDSTGLLAALAAVAKAEPSVSLIAATVDHRLRPGSTEEAHAAGVLCEKLSIPHHVLTWQGDKPQSGIQAAAREARYRLLGGLAQEIGADLIVTAHTGDDQAETMAMRRRRNPEAEAGISDAVLYDRHVWVLRPFLGVGRQEIRDYLVERGIGWVDDPSNENEIFERVRVRKALSQGAGVRDTPLCPAGHLPLKGGDWQGARSPLQTNVAIDTTAEKGETAPHPISPLEGEMPGRAEGGGPLACSTEEAAASFLLADVTIRSILVAAVDLTDYSPENPAHLTAIRHLAAMLGGRTYLGGQATGAWIAQFLAAPDEKRLTAERVVFDKRRQSLYLTRERRSLPDMVIAARSTMVWDNRFRIRNAGDAPVRIGVRGEEQGEAILTSLLSPDLPAGVRQRALAVEPVILSGPSESVRIEPVITHFDRFLPLRLLPVANALAFLFGLDHFPGLPTR